MVQLISIYPLPVNGILKDYAANMKDYLTDTLSPDIPTNNVKLY